MTEEILKGCTVEGNVVKLPPGKLERDVYTKIAKALEDIGGKWNRKHQGFLFKSDPSLLLTEQANGGNRNLKQEFQSFFTPPDLAKEVVPYLWVEKGMRVLEPSAGTGNLVKAVFEEFKFLKEIAVCELNQEYERELEKIQGVSVIASDFLSLDEKMWGGYFDRIIANPPFTKGQDIKHIYHMYKMLKPGGRMISFASTGWTWAEKNPGKAFREWIDLVEGSVVNLGEGRFKSSGTLIETCYIEIDKPKNG